MNAVKKRDLLKTNAKKTFKAWQLYVLLIPALLWAIIFAYYPMYGVVIAFKDYKIRAGILGSPWADPLLKYFQQFFSTSIALNAIKNTIVISLESLVIAFPIPIIFALLLNQIRGDKTKKTIQTISYAPYFMSNVVVVSIISVFFGERRCKQPGYKRRRQRNPVYLSARMVPDSFYRLQHLADHGL